MNEGDCFKANAEYVINLFVKNKKRKVLREYKLCHGFVIGAKGSSAEWKKFIHCWIELGNDVVMDFSNGKEIVGKKEQIQYRIIEDSVKRYTPKQVIANVLKYSHYGEWD